MDSQTYLVQAQGLELKFRLWGQQGPCILLLHGFGGSPLDWSEIAQELKHNYRLIAPDLRPFFSSLQPITFSQQAHILSQALWLFINQHFKAEASPQIHIVGSSYGSALGWTLQFTDLPEDSLLLSDPPLPPIHHLLKTNNKLDILSYTLINPMPHSPIKYLRSWELRVLFMLSSWPRILSLYLRSSLGQRKLVELGQIFRMGLRGQGRLKNFNDRKLKLVYKALKRFLWIIRQEDWSKWNQQKSHSHLLVLAADKDSVFQQKGFKSYLTLCQNSMHFQYLLKANHHALSSHAQAISTHLKNHITETQKVKKLSAAAVLAIATRFSA